MIVMACLPVSKKKKIAITMLVRYIEIMPMLALMMAIIIEMLAQLNIRISKKMMFVYDRTFDERMKSRMANLRFVIMENDQVCIVQLRMDRRAFWKFCKMLKVVGKLEINRNIVIEEMVVIFFHIVAHHSKNRVIQLVFCRSGETISRYFNVVLNAILRLHTYLLKKPEPITETSNNKKWKWFNLLVKLIYHSYCCTIILL